MRIIKIAIIGSRNININIGAYIPVYCSVVICSSVTKIDRMAEEYAYDNNIELIQFKPDYDSHGKLAPIKACKQMIEAADSVIAFWDGKSSGTRGLIEYTEYLGKKIRVVCIKENGRHI